jgi:hypothetical protein
MRSRVPLTPSRLTSSGLPRNIVTEMIAFGAELSMVQRIGYGLLSLLPLLAGLAAATAFYEDLRGGETPTFLGAAVGISLITGTLWVGVCMVINILTFPKDELSHSHRSKPGYRLKRKQSLRRE